MRSWLASLRRVLRVVAWTSIVLGLLVLGFVAQQLFVTTWFAQQNQVALSSEIENRFASAEITEVAYTPPVVVGENPTASGDGVPPREGGVGAGHVFLRRDLEVALWRRDHDDGEALGR